jgi:signal transduction histidine kinase
VAYIKLRFTKNLGEFYGDEARLKQALFGLLSYGMNHIEDEEELYLIISPFEDGKGVIFEAKSSGLKNLNAHSLGLGLSIVKRLIDLHGGSLSFSPGSIFISLPRSMAQELAA